MKKVKKTFESVSEIRSSLTKNQYSILQKFENELDGIHHRVCLQWNRIVYKFPNGSLVYTTLVDDDSVILWLMRWAKLIKKYPILSWAFDENLQSVSKIYCTNSESIESRWVKDLVVLMSQIDTKKDDNSKRKN